MTDLPMTDRYDLLLASIANNDLFIVQMFLFAFFAVLAYPVLTWTPVWMQRPARYFYLASLLVLFLVTVFFRQA